MSIYKLEMSFENSFASIPLMGAETNEIWDFISQSWNFRKVSHSFTSSLLTEAVELCLRRNLIFLQENSDFASLSIKDRKVLYNNNMGSMCHVRGVMQHTTKHDFLVSCKQKSPHCFFHLFSLCRCEAARLRRMCKVGV